MTPKRKLKRLPAVRRFVAEACDDKVGTDVTLPNGVTVHMHVRVQYRLDSGELVRRFLGYGPTGGIYEDLQEVTPANPDPKPVAMSLVRWPLPSRGEKLGPFRDTRNCFNDRVLYCGMQPNGHPRMLTLREREGEWRCAPLSGIIYHENVYAILNQRSRKVL